MNELANKCLECGGATHPILVIDRGEGNIEYDRNSAPIVVEVAGGDEATGEALAKAYDDPAVTKLRVFALGDGEAMSGLLVAGKRKSGEATFLVFLAD